MAMFCAAVTPVVPWLNRTSTRSWGPMVASEETNRAGAVVEFVMVIGVLTKLVVLKKTTSGSSGTSIMFWTTTLRLAVLDGQLPLE